MAAPTAGLHFTPRVLDALRNKGVELEELMIDIVKQGKALYVGISKYPPMQAKVAYEILRSAGVPYSSCSKESFWCDK